LAGHHDPRSRSGPCSRIGRPLSRALGSRNNRAENSHQPTRRERIIKRYKSPRQGQRFLSTHDQIANIFSRCPNQDSAAKLHSARRQAFAIWAEVTGVAMAA
jgi:putative transposase